MCEANKGGISGANKGGVGGANKNGIGRANIEASKKANTGVVASTDNSIDDNGKVTD